MAGIHLEETIGGFGTDRDGNGQSITGLDGIAHSPLTTGGGDGTEVETLLACREVEGLGAFVNRTGVGGGDSTVAAAGPLGLDLFDSAFHVTEGKDICLGGHAGEGLWF